LQLNLLDESALEKLLAPAANQVRPRDTTGPKLLDTSGPGYPRPRTLRQVRP
jgi:hypothetical protein